MKDVTYQQYVDILHEELILALGCTEPACLALAGAKVREVLGCIPTSVEVKLNRELFKNANSVCIPNGGHLKGIGAAIALGIVGGQADLGLEVLSLIGPEQVEEAEKLLSQKDYCSIEIFTTPAKLHLIVTARAGEGEASVEILHCHTNITKVVLNGKTLVDTGEEVELASREEDHSLPMSVQEIIHFADTVQLEEVEAVLMRQVDCNLKIAEAGLAAEYGVQIGQKLLAVSEPTVERKARAVAAAGADARMGGCSLPVVINSGSGNQGITVSMPVVTYAEHFQIPKEKMLRALVVANLISIHLKSKIGRLSAYCGAVSAACGSGAGITYLLGGDYQQVVKTITNTLGNISGMICDGAKASCAAKVATAVDAALLGHTLAMADLAFSPGDGIIKSDVEETIAGVCLISSQGMEKTDEVVLKVVLDK